MQMRYGLRKRCRCVMGCASGVKNVVKNARLTARLGRDLHVEDGVAAVVVRQLGGEVLEGGALRGEGRGA